VTSLALPWSLKQWGGPSHWTKSNHTSETLNSHLTHQQTCIHPYTPNNDKSIGQYLKQCMIRCMYSYNESVCTHRRPVNVLALFLCIHIHDFMHTELLGFIAPPFIN